MTKLLLPFLAFCILFFSIAPFENYCPETEKTCQNCPEKKCETNTDCCDFCLLNCCKVLFTSTQFIFKTFLKIAQKPFSFYQLTPKITVQNLVWQPPEF